MRIRYPHFIDFYRKLIHTSTSFSGRVRIISLEMRSYGDGRMRGFPEVSLSSGMQPGHMGSTFVIWIFGVSLLRTMDTVSLEVISNHRCMRVATKLDSERILPSQSSAVKIDRSLALLRELGG